MSSENVCCCDVESESYVFVMWGGITLPRVTVCRVGLSCSAKSDVG